MKKFKPGTRGLVSNSTFPIRRIQMKKVKQRNAHGMYFFFHFQTNKNSSVHKKTTDRYFESSSAFVEIN